MESISRKTFIQSSGLLLAGEILVKKPGTFASGAAPQAETGFVYEDGEVVATETGLFAVRIEDGKIVAVLPNGPKADATDAKRQLILPLAAFRDVQE